MSIDSYFSELIEELNSKLFSKQSQATKVILLEGDLGVGKTQFVKEFLRARGFDSVQSPTYLKMLDYDVVGIGKVLHLDCYRVDSVGEISNLSLEHYEEVALIFVEWPKIFLKYLETEFSGLHEFDCELLDLKVNPKGKRSWSWQKK